MLALLCLRAGGLVCPLPATSVVAIVVVKTSVAKARVCRRRMVCLSFSDCFSRHLTFATRIKVVTGVEQEGAAYGLALDVEGGVAFVGGHDTNSGGTDDLLIVALEEDTGEVCECAREV